MSISLRAKRADAERVLAPIVRIQDVIVVHIWRSVQARPHLAGCSSFSRVLYARNWSQAFRSEVEVYFGWSISHEAQVGGFIDNRQPSNDFDEYRLIVHPVALGSGLRLFAELAAALRLKLADTTIFKTGTIAKICRPV